MTRANVSSQSNEQRTDSKLKRFGIRAWRYISSPARIKQLIVSAAMYILLIGLAFVFIYPFLYMFVTSLKSNSDLGNYAVQWIPSSLKFENYSIVTNVKLLNYWKYAKNTLIVTVLSTFGHIMAGSFVGYGFARFRFPFKKILFGLVMLAFIVPTTTLIVPLYITYSRLAWLDTYLPLIVPTIFGFGLNGALYIFLFRQFYLTLPKDLENAALIDGCSFFKTYWKIVFPLAQSTLVVAMVLSVVWHWNDAYEPGIYVRLTNLQFLPPRIRTIVSMANAPSEDMFDLMQQLGLDDGEDTLNNAVVMAGATLISAPVLVFFAFAQKKFIQGIERSGITGE